jgi:hypothetical protein
MPDIWRQTGRGRACQALSGGQELAAHPEVREQGVAVVEGEPEELSTPDDVDHPGTGQPIGEVDRPLQVPTHRPGMQNLHRTEPGSDDPVRQAPPDDFDLG